MILALIIIPGISQSEIINKIEAHVGNRIITNYDIINLDPKTYERILLIPDDEEKKNQLEEFKRLALDFLIDNIVIEISAERENIVVGNQEVNKAIEEIAKQNKMSMAAFEKQLIKQGTSLERFKYGVRSEIIAGRIRALVLAPKIVVTTEDINHVIDKNADKYGAADSYKLHIINTQTKSDLRKVLKKIKKGMSIEEAAQKYSIDQSALTGGDLGWNNVLYLDIEMENALKKSKVGEFTKMFKYNGSWAVCYIDDFKSKYEIDDNIKNKIVQDISEKLFKKVYEDWIRKNKETIVILKATDKFMVN